MTHLFFTLITALSIVSADQPVSNKACMATIAERVEAVTLKDRRPFTLNAKVTVENYDDAGEVTKRDVYVVVNEMSPDSFVSRVTKNDRFLANVSVVNGRVREEMAEVKFAGDRVLRDVVLSYQNFDMDLQPTHDPDLPPLLSLVEFADSCSIAHVITSWHSANTHFGFQALLDKIRESTELETPEERERFTSNENVRVFYRTRGVSLEQAQSGSGVFIEEVTLIDQSYRMVEYKVRANSTLSHFTRTFSFEYEEKRASRN